MSQLALIILFIVPYLWVSYLPLWNILGAINKLIIFYVKVRGAGLMFNFVWLVQN